MKLDLHFQSPAPRLPFAPASPITESPLKAVPFRPPNPLPCRLRYQIFQQRHAPSGGARSLASVAGAVAGRVFTGLGLPLLLLAGVAVPACASVIAVERADYGVTSSLNGLNGGSGWGSAWTGDNNVVAGSLSRPSVPTAGNRLSTDGNNAVSYRLLATAGQETLLTPGGEFGKEGTTIWVSCLMRRDADSGAGSGRYAGLSFFHNGGAEELLIGIPWEAANWGIHFHDLGANAPGLSSTPIVTGTTVWLVARITFGYSGTSDRVDLFVNPSPTVAPTTPAVTRSGGNIQFTVVRLASGNTATAISMDELRIGTTWEDVSPAAEQNFPLPLGSAVVHSVGVFKLEQFSQSTNNAVSGPNSARFEAYAYGWPKDVSPPRTNGWYGWFRPASPGAFGWEMTSMELQTITPWNEFYDRRMYLGDGPFQFYAHPPSVQYPTRAALDAAWPDQVYSFALTNVYRYWDPVFGDVIEETPLGKVDVDLMAGGYSVSAPVIANYARLQAWPRTVPLEIQWQPFAGGGAADFVQVDLFRNFGNSGSSTFVNTITPPAGEPGVLPATATNYLSGPNFLIHQDVQYPATDSTATITFFNVTRINTNQYPGCLGISGVARQTSVSIHFVDPIASSLSVLASNRVEGSGSPEMLALEVRLSPPSNTEISVNYATVDETAIAGEDYQAVSGTLIFAPGETSKLVQVPIIPDSKPEADETFKLVLSSPVIGAIAQAQAVATITNDDGGSNSQPQVVIPIPDTNGVYGTPFDFTFAANAFSDPDTGQTLSYAVSGLPAEIMFTPATRTFSGIPTSIGTNSVTITATDDGSPALSTNAVFALVIAKAPLVVTAFDTNRVYGTTNPPLTGSIVGLVNGDNITVTFATTATIDSPPGTYPITPILSDSDGRLINYDTTTNQGTLTILSPPELSLSFSSGGGDQLTLSWPASYAKFVLEYTENLTPPIDWQEITDGIIENGGIKSYALVIDPQVSKRFFRLRLP